MNYLAAAFPILVVLGLMLALRWGGQRAGPLGWLSGLAAAALAFGLNWDVLWVSQAKGVLLSVYVLYVLVPALYLYHLVNGVGGVRAIGAALQRGIRDRGVLLLALAWAFSSLLEGLAGFGMPIAIVAPMLVGLGVAPAAAVAAVAIGHAWSVTFGDMGVIYQTLVGVTKVDAQALAGPAALLCGLACLGCGLAAAWALGQRRRAWVALAVGGVMAGVQYALAVGGLPQLGALGAGSAGLLACALLSRLLVRGSAGRGGAAPGLADEPSGGALSGGLAAALGSYGFLTVLMTLLAVTPPLKAALAPLAWIQVFPAAATGAGFQTPAGEGPAFRWFLHPGSALLLTGLLSYPFFVKRGWAQRGDWRKALEATRRSAAPVSVGVISMVGLSALMEHTGMTQLLAQGLSALVGGAFPLVSPLVGILGAFATGSNNNSNVLFAPLQKSAAELLKLDVLVLLAAQTTGGALGSMIAPAKIILGTSTLGLKGIDGEVLRKTLGVGIALGLLAGVGALIMAR